MTHANAQGVSADLRRRATTRFAERFPGEGPRVAVSPGRVNLIGHEAKIDLPAALYPCRPEAGARLLEQAGADRLVIRRHRDWPASRPAAQRRFL